MLAASCSGSTSGCFRSHRRASAESRRLPLIAAAASKSAPPPRSRGRLHLWSSADSARLISISDAASRGRKAALFWAECCPLLLGQSARLRGSLSSLCLLPECPQAPPARRGARTGRGQQERSQLLALVFVSVPSPPLPGCHVHLRSCRAQSGDNGRLSDHFCFQFKNVAAGIRPGIILAALRGGGGRGGGRGGGPRLCQVHGRDGRLAPTSAAPPSRRRRARLHGDSLMTHLGGRRCV